MTAFPNKYMFDQSLIGQSNCISHAYWSIARLLVNRLYIARLLVNQMSIARLLVNRIVYRTFIGQSNVLCICLPPIVFYATV